MTSKLLLVALLLVTPHAARAADLNAYVLKAISEMPAGGKYAANDAAAKGLIDAVRIGQDFHIEPKDAIPSFCTTATYLVFLRALEHARDAGALSSPLSALAYLLPPQSVDSLFKDDGRGLWGRWNSNGPGTARLFHELALGPNFSGWAKKKPGDFMKIFWTVDVGKKERGHSVVYLAERLNPETNAPEVQYWSSNQPNGYGKAWVARSKIINAIFSRLSTPEGMDATPSVPEWDDYLASLLTTESSFEEAKEKSGVTD